MVAVTLNAVPEPVVVMLFALKAITRVLELAELNERAVKLNPLSVNVPLVSVNAPVVVYVDCRVTVIPAPLTTVGLVRVTPFVVMEQVPLKVIVPVFVQLTPANTNKPLVVIPIAEEPAKVRVPAYGFSILIPSTAVVAVLVQV